MLSLVSDETSETVIAELCTLSSGALQPESFLQESARQSKPVIFVTSSHPHRKGNAAVLLGAWLILFEDYTGEAAYSALQRAEPFTPFRDASCGHSQFGLTVKHVLAV